MEPRHDIERHYDTLGIAPGASLEEIKAAYRQMVKIWHPDRFSESSALKPVADENLKKVNEAYRAILKQQGELKERRGGDNHRRAEVRAQQQPGQAHVYQGRNSNAKNNRAAHSPARGRRLPLRHLSSWFSNQSRNIREHGQTGGIQWLYCLLPGLGVLLLRHQAAKKTLHLSPAGIKGLTIASFLGFSIFFLVEMVFGRNTPAILICWVVLMGLLAKKATVKAPSTAQLLGFLSQINILVTLLFLMVVIRLLLLRSA